MNRKGQKFVAHNPKVVGSNPASGTTMLGQKSLLPEAYQIFSKFRSSTKIPLME